MVRIQELNVYWGSLAASLGTNPGSQPHSINVEDWGQSDVAVG
jgi:hypothetical protein